MEKRFDISINDTVQWEVPYFNSSLTHTGTVLKLRGNIATVEYSVYDSIVKKTVKQTNSMIITRLRKIEHVCI